MVLRYTQLRQSYLLKMPSKLGKKMKIQKALLGVIWLFISLINPNIGSAQVHISGNVEFQIIGSGSLSAVGEDGLHANFRFPKSGDTYYLHQLSEIWVGDANGNVASTWDIDPAEPRLGDGEWGATSMHTERIDPDEQQTITTGYDSIGTIDFPINISVDQQSFSWSTNNHPDADDFIVMKLVIKNDSNERLEGIYVATMTNWDVDGTDLAAGELSRDWVDWDEAHQTLFTYDGDDTDGLNPVHTGLTLLDGKLSTHQIFPFYGPEGQPTANLFLDESRSVFMTNPNVFAASKNDLEVLDLLPWDYASIISAGPYDIPAKQFIAVTFALVAGEDLADLQKNINAARAVTFAPQRLTAEIVRGAVRLKWKEPINPSVEGYTILRRASDESQFRQIGQIIKETTFDDGEIQTGVEYTYKIRPVHTSGQPLEFDSSEVRITPGSAPDTPVGLAATRNGDQIILGWTKSTRDINRYLIYRNHTGRDPWTQIASVPPGASTFVDQDVYPGWQYFYAITAINSSGGESQLSQIVDITIPEEPIASPEPNLDKVIFIPNPYRLNGGTHPMEFRNLPHRATIRIYNSTGDLIKQIDHRNNTSIQRWDGRNGEGNQISAGIYIYHIESLRKDQRGKNSVSGKFAVIR